MFLSLHNTMSMSLPYPNGLVGQPWTPAASGWPGIDGVSGDRNYLPVNTYPVDPQTQPAIDSRAPPADVYKGGSRRTKNHSRKRKHGRRSRKGGQHPGHSHFNLVSSGGRRRHRRSRSKGRSRSRGSRGGGIVDDFISPIGYHAQSAYNTLNGMMAPVDPRPFVDQLVANPANI